MNRDPVAPAPRPVTAVDPMAQPGGGWSSTPPGYLPPSAPVAPTPWGMVPGAQPAPFSGFPGASVARPDQSRLWILPAVTAGLLVLGYVLPFWSVSNVFMNQDMTFSEDFGENWQVLAGAVLVGVGALDLYRRAEAGLGVAAGSLLNWMPTMVLLIAVTEKLIKEVDNGSNYAEANVSYGIGGMLWFIALLVGGAVVVVALVRDLGDRDAPRASGVIGAVVGIAGLVAVAGFLGVGSDETNPIKYLTDDLFSGPFLADVAMVGWIGGIAVVSVLAWVRRTPITLGLVAGLSLVWLTWVLAGDSSGASTTAGSIDVDTLFGLSITVAGTAAALGILLPHRETALPPGGTVDLRGVPFSALAVLVLAPLLGFAGLVT